MNSWLIGLCLAFFFIFPTNNVFFVVNILFLLYSFRYRNKSFKNWAIVPFMLIALGSFIFNIVNLPSSLLIKESFRIANILSFLYILPMLYKDINFKILGYCLFLTLITVFITQLAFLFNIQSIVDFVDRYYPYEGDALGLTTDYIIQHTSGSLYDISIRFSGIYRNPNQCSRFVLLLATAILYFSNRNVKIATITISFLSVLMTGSRTGFLVLLSILVAYMFFVQKKRLNYFWITIGVVFLTFINSRVYMSNYRAFALEEGVDTSFATKFVWFFKFIANEDNLLYLLFGHGTAANVAEYGIPMLDSEWGMMIFSYGITGFVLYLCLLLVFIKKAPSKSKAVFVNLLWIISSTVFLSYRMCIVFVIILSLIWQYGNLINTENSKSRKSNII